MYPRPAELKTLLTGKPAPAEVETLLAPVGFLDAPSAFERLERTAGEGEGRALFADCLPSLLLELSDTAQPDQALINFERFAHSVPDRPALFRNLRENPRAVEILVRLF